MLFIDECVLDYLIYVIYYHAYVALEVIINKRIDEYMIRQTNYSLIIQNMLFTILGLIGPSIQLVIVDSFCYCWFGTKIGNQAVDLDMLLIAY